MSTSRAGGLADAVDLGDAQAADALHIAIHGDVKIATVGDLVGGHDLRKLSRLIGVGGAISFDVKVSADEPLTLEIEEIDGRGGDVRGYSVFIDNRPVYFRTYRGCGAGAVHYFVQVPPPSRDRVTVKFINRGSSAVAIGRVWAWGDFENFFDANGFDVPFYLAPTVPLSGDLEADRASLAKIKSSLGTRANVMGAWTTWIAYAAKSPEKCAARIDEALALAEEFDLPVQICFDSWWANTPAGPDGHGGHWTDEKYQQLVWNETTRQTQLSVPNHWSNTPWLTMNDPDLNAFKANRAKLAAQRLAKRLAELQARGKRSALLSVNLDNEPIYWASGNAGLGTDLLWADFNLRTVAAAKADGVTLDPRDGLDRNERLWLWRNLLKYNDLIAGSVVDGLGRDACVVTKKSSTPASDLLADNVYTQAMMMSDPQLQFPMQRREFPLWESAAPAKCRVGGEWNGGALPEREGVEHQISLGRNAAINAECENDAANHRGVAMAYALGQRYYTPYNYPVDQMNVAAGDLNDVAKEFPVDMYERVLSEELFDSDGWMKHIIARDGVLTKRIGNTTAVAVCPASARANGSLTYRIDRSANAAGGLAVEISGRANDFRGIDPAVQIRMLAGASEDASTMREMTIITQNADLNAVHHVDLSEIAAGQQAVFVRIELIAPTLPENVLDWCAVWRVRFTQGWGADLTRDLPKQDRSMRLVRKQNLLVSWRRDAELAIARLNGNADAVPAQRLYDEGKFAAAYQTAAQAVCLMLPATFVVRGSGKLANYPIEVESKRDVTLILKSCSEKEVRIACNSGDPSNVMLKISRLHAGGLYSAAMDGGDWVLRMTRGGEGVVSERGEWRGTMKFAVVH